MSDIFVDVENVETEATVADSNIYSAHGAIAIGNGTNVFRADQSGIWLGAKEFSTAPFKVDMQGNVTMTTATITGYVATGGAAADVNAGVTSIVGSKINITGDTTFAAGYNPTDKVDEVGGNYVSTSTAAAAKVKIFPDANTGIVAYASNGTSVVFKVEVGGTNVGDVTIGDYAGGNGVLWDQSASKLYVKGDLVAGTVVATTLTGDIDEDRIVDNVLAALKTKLANNGTNYLSAIVSNVGTITAGTVYGVDIYSSGTATDNRIFLDSGDYLRFYRGGTERMRLRGSSASGATGIIAEIGSFVTKNEEGFYAATSTSYDNFTKLYSKNVSPYGMSGVIELPDENKLLIMKSDMTKAYMTISDSGTYIEKLSSELNANNNLIKNIGYMEWNTGSNKDNTGEMWFYTSGGNYYLRMDMGSRQQFDTHGV